METMRYDPEDQRWVVGQWELHCGDELDIRWDGRWVPVRIERLDGPGWVLFTSGDAIRILPGRNIVARLPQAL